MKNILSSSNYFSRNFQLYFNKEERYSSKIGVSLSFMINIIIIYLSWVSVLDVMNRKNVNVNSVRKKVKIPSNMTLYDDLFVMTDIVNDATFSVIDPTVVSLNAMYAMVNIPEGIVNIIHLNTTDCSQYFTPYENNTELLSALTYFKSNKCFSKPENTQLVIGGSYDTNFYGLISIYISKCINGTVPDVTCKPQSEIDNILMKSYFELRYVNTYIDTNDYNHPFTNYLESSFFVVNPNQGKIMNNYFNKFSVNTEDGWMFSNEYDLDGYKFDYAQFDTFNQLNDGTIANINLISSTNIENYYRKYMKLQDVIAQLGGALKFFTFVFGIICAFIDKLYMKQIIIDDLFGLNSNNSNNDNNDNKNKKIGDKLKSSTKQLYPVDEQSKSKIDKSSIRCIKKEEIADINSPAEINNYVNAKKIKEIKKVKEAKKIKINVHAMYFRFFKLPCPSETAKHDNELFNKMEEKLYKYIDILGIVHVLKEFMLLKKLILNEKQEILFNKIKKFEDIEDKVAESETEKIIKEFEQSTHEKDKILVEMLHLHD